MTNCPRRRKFGKICSSLGMLVRRMDMLQASVLQDGSSLGTQARRSVCEAEAGCSPSPGEAGAAAEALAARGSSSPNTPFLRSITTPTAHTAAANAITIPASTPIPIDDDQNEITAAELNETLGGGGESGEDGLGGGGSAGGELGGCEGGGDGGGLGGGQGGGLGGRLGGGLGGGDG
eukprot:CAMPEP_0180099222 /NCGR_PEP_ID=MMETSP0985-20121206/28196_1 /TAXON_ID=483367 /ORGANISM="non described non described, Strain CCMP 2436" /LENGTH=176 /DNA_ID=CAMNT_0022034769 /DNA_START=660 /DNA_END=1186 /DNA_ORIENTATION=+